MKYERSFPTWMYMGMPLAVRADIDTDVRIVERTDVDTKHCFTYCDVHTGEPTGYELESLEGEEGSEGKTQVRSSSAYGCSSSLLTSAGKVTPEQAAAFEFKHEACSVTVQVRFVSGLGDARELDSELKGEFGKDISVGLWDPRGHTVSDSLVAELTRRRLSNSSESGRGVGSGENRTLRGTGRVESRDSRRRKLDEDVDGVRGTRYKEYNQDVASALDHYAEIEINSFTQSPRGTLAIALGVGAVSDIRTYLASLQNLPTDAVASAAARPVATATSLLLLLAVVLGIVRNARGWLTVALVLLAVPLAAATHALCGCGRRAEVVISVPRGFSFSRFEFSGEGRVACSNCDGAESGDYSTTAAPYAAEPPVAPTAIDEVFTTMTKPMFFDPRYLLSRPLKFEATTPTHVLIQSHGFDEIEHCHPADPNNNYIIGSEPTPMGFADGETALYGEQQSGHTVGGNVPYGCARNSYVKAHAHLKSTSAAKVNFLPTADAFTVQVGPSVVNEFSGTQRVGPMKLVQPSQLSVGAVIALLAATMHHSTGNRWVMIGLLFGASAVWAQQASSDVVVVLDMPMGLCFSEVDLGDLSQITCPDCDAWTCPTKPGSDPPGPANAQSSGAAASDQSWMASLKAQWSEFAVATKSLCAAGGFDATIFTRGLHDNDLPDTTSGFVRLATDHTIGCEPCEAGTWMRTQGGDCTECPYPTRCTGNNECAYNFTGTACAVCTPNFYQEEDDDHPDGFCEVCPEPTAVGFVLFAVGTICSVLVFVLMTIKGTAVVKGQQALEDLQDAAESIQEQVEEAISMVKQTLTYMQALVLLVGAKQFETPEWMTELKQKIQSYAFVNIAEILDMKLPSDCIIQGKETTLQDIYWHRIGATQWLFWLVCIICLILSLIFNCMQYEKTKPVLPNFLGTAASTPTAVAGTMYSTLYITLLSSAVRTFDCTTDDDGVSRLDDYPDIECWTGKALTFQVLGVLCTFLYIFIWVAVAWNQVSNFKKFAGGDGDLDAEELRRLQASQNVKNRELVDKDGDGIIDEKEMAELDKIKNAEASEGATTTADVVKLVKSEVVLSEMDMQIEAAEYAKKTVLVLTVVFLGSHPWKTWIILVLAYCGYYVVRIKSLENHAQEADDDVRNLLPFISEKLQLVGEFSVVVLSAYFINRPESEQGWVVMVPIGLFNGAAALFTFIYVVWFWKDVFAHCRRLKNQVVHHVSARTASTESREDNAVNSESEETDVANDPGEIDKAHPSADTADENLMGEGGDAGSPGAFHP